MPTLDGGANVTCTTLLSQASLRADRVSGAMLICYKVNVSGGVTVRVPGNAPMIYLMQREAKRPPTHILNLQLHLRARVVFVGASRRGGETLHVLHCLDDTAKVEPIRRKWNSKRLRSDPAGPAGHSQEGGGGGGGAQLRRLQSDPAGPNGPPCRVTEGEDCRWGIPQDPIALMRA